MSIIEQLKPLSVRVIMDFNGNLLTRCGKTYGRAFLSWYEVTPCHTASLMPTTSHSGRAKLWRTLGGINDLVNAPFLYPKLIGSP